LFKIEEKRGSKKRVKRLVIKMDRWTAKNQTSVKIRSNKKESSAFCCPSVQNYND